MKRSPITRRSPMVRARRRVRKKLPRPGVTPPMPKEWRALCERVRARDANRCRRCRVEAMGQTGQVNHILPRRLFTTGLAASRPENLALLCLRCHGYFTGQVEPRLFRGDVLCFELALAILKQTGPTPSSLLLMRAYARLRRLTNAQIA